MNNPVCDETLDHHGGSVWIDRQFGRFDSLNAVIIYGNHIRPSDEMEG